MFLSRSTGRKVVATGVAAVALACLYEVTVFDSRYAALYYPWVVVANPNARPGRDDIPREIALPPSGVQVGPVSVGFYGVSFVVSRRPRPMAIRAARWPSSTSFTRPRRRWRSSASSSR